ncbi:DUF1127 domain-containing protein [Pseudomonas sp. Fl4BN1]|uniref:DUF1127 domain-containing protein n=1 Tax=Pseudomonas sp. Fl4BN1 TaxID=2697651 RepID=UPI00137723FD|nr:DUF1127 domain-containing protein [Pseudomonas sp. Fl4BN1]NBF09439.1 DUF1127 domain-containing protein [Pseudomonas sp. Fl4BN1]
MNSSLRQTSNSSQVSPRFSTVRSWIHALRNMQERARTRRLLSQMDERELSDSGISHCEQTEELRKPFWR